MPKPWSAGVIEAAERASAKLRSGNTALSDMELGALQLRSWEKVNGMNLPTVKRLVYGLGEYPSKDGKRCQANVLEATARWRTQAGKDYRCELTALYVVNGHHFCKRHAGNYLLRILWLGEELPLVERPTRPNKPANAKGKRQSKQSRSSD
mgnify:CR=1 FL=1